MALVEEDGTGLPNANSYASVNTADDIVDLYGLEWPQGANKEASLIAATDYLDASITPPGKLLDDEQSLNFPREQFTDRQGRIIEGLPAEIVKATVFLAVEHSQDSLFAQKVALKSQSFGDSSETYATSFTESDQGSYIFRRLIALGYGQRSSTTVRITRA